jgi:hypothetical protein
LLRNHFHDRWVDASFDGVADLFRTAYPPPITVPAKPTHFETGTAPPIELMKALAIAAIVFGG